LTLAAYVNCRATANAERIPFTQAERPEQRADMAIVYVYRTVAMPLLFSVGVYVDNMKRADLPGHHFTWFYVAPGQHRLKFRWPILAVAPTVEFSQTVEAGQTYAYQFTGSVDVFPERVISRVARLDPDTAAAAMEACCSYRPVIAAASAGGAPATAPSKPQ
jgi:hypothetical protein